MDAIGFRPEDRPYSPHITLARLDEPAPPEIIDRYLDENRGFVVPSVQIDRFILYSSRFVDNVPKYQEEETFPLPHPVPFPWTYWRALNGNWTPRLPRCQNRMPST